LSPDRVALHAARVGGGLEYARISVGLDRAGRQPALGPRLADLDPMAAPLERLYGCGRDAGLDRDGAEPRLARPERAWEMIDVERRGVDRLLQVHAVVGVMEEQQERPLLLLVAARRAERQVGRAVPEGERGRERGARPLAGRKARVEALVEPEQ